MKAMLRVVTRLALALVFFGIIGFCRSSSASEFELRQYDEVYFKDGTVARGTLIDTDKEDVKKIRDLRTQATREVSASDVKEIRRRATPESEMNRLAQKYAGRADKIFAICREVMDRFDSALWPKLIPILEKESSSRNVDALSLLTELYLWNNQPKDALRTAEALVAAAPDKGRPYMMRGKAQLALDNREAAEKDLAKAFNLTPDDQDIVVARADFLLAAGRSKEAQDMFAAALGKNGRNNAALIGRGMVLLRQGEFGPAEQSFKEALANDANLKQAKIGLAAARVMLKQYDDACAEAKTVLNLDNKSADAFAVQAFAKLMSGNPDSMKDFYTNLKLALEEKPNQPRLLLAAAVALEREAKVLDAQGAPEAAQKRNEANAKYAEILSSDPNDAYLQYFIGERKFRNGDYAGAEKNFIRVTKLAPGYAPGHGALGAVSLRLGKWEKAKEAYSEALKIDSNSKEAGDYYAGKGLAWLKVKMFEEASAALKQARELDRHNANALCGLGYIANGEKNKASAIEFFQQALAADGSCDYAADALRKIFSQDNMNLEYVTFGLADDKIPFGWKMKPGGSVKATVTNGQVLFAGVQGQGTGNKVEIQKEVKADDFVRFEADLEIAPTSAVTCGIHLASATNANISFELEFGKDETNEIKVRYRDFGGVTPQWQSVKSEWPSDGRVRLGIDTEDLKTGKINLWVNGKKAGTLAMTLQKPNRITLGAFVQAPPKEDVRATVDNIVLVTRGPAIIDKEGEGLQLNKDDEKKPAPEAPKP